jgi:hypothetical protein
MKTAKDLDAVRFTLIKGTPERRANITAWRREAMRLLDMASREEVELAVQTKCDLEVTHNFVPDGMYVNNFVCLNCKFEYQKPEQEN